MLIIKYRNSIQSKPNNRHVYSSGLGFAALKTLINSPQYILYI